MFNTGKGEEVVSVAWIAEQDDEDQDGAEDNGASESGPDTGDDVQE